MKNEEGCTALIQNNSWDKELFVISSFLYVLVPLFVYME